MYVIDSSIKTIHLSVFIFYFLETYVII